MNFMTNQGKYENFEKSYFSSWNRKYCNAQLATALEISFHIFVEIIGQVFVTFWFLIHRVHGIFDLV